MRDNRQQIDEAMAQIDAENKQAWRKRKRQGRLLDKSVHEEASIVDDPGWYGERGQIVETITIERRFIPDSERAGVRPPATKSSQSNSEK